MIGTFLTTLQTLLNFITQEISLNSHLRKIQEKGKVLLMEENQVTLAMIHFLGNSSISHMELY